MFTSEETVSINPSVAIKKRIKAAGSNKSQARVIWNRGLTGNLEPLSSVKDG